MMADEQKRGQEQRPEGQQKSDKVKQPAITSKPIPEITINAGEAFAISFADYFSVDEGDQLTYVFDQFPEGLTFDKQSGRVSGIAPKVPFDTPYLVSVTGINAHTQETTIEYFPLIILSTETAEAGERTMPEISDILDSASLLDPARRWELLRVIQYIINEHYAVVFLYDAERELAELGLPLDLRKVKTGFTVVNFDYAIVVAPGEKAFAPYGNRGRLLRTLQEVYDRDIPKRKWSFIGVEGSDKETIGKAWVMAKLLNLPVAEDAPSDAAQFNLRNLKRIVGDTIKPGKKLIP